MAETPYTKFRLAPHTLSDLAALAASAGNLSAAVRECVAHWYRAVSEAGRLNANDLSRDEWHLLAHTGDPSSPYDGTDERAIRYPDWSRILATELAGVWEGKPLLLPSHREEKKASERLARKIGGWGPVRGYALMAAVRWFWKHPDTADAWWWPEVWLVAETREGE